MELTSEELATLEQLTLPSALYPNWFAAKMLDPLIADALK